MRAVLSNSCVLPCRDSMADRGETTMMRVLHSHTSTQHRLTVRWPAWIRFALPAYLFLAVSNAQSAVIPAFPGADGNGVMTPGGRGGDVYLVTTLADSGPGSLRAGCEAEGPRFVVVNVAGTIELESPIEVGNPFVTIAGQAAPGNGVQLKNHGLRISASDVVVRYLRIRPGAGPGVVIEDSERVVIDHCSVAWTEGTAISVSGSSRDVTVQWCLVAESLSTPNESQGMGVRLAFVDGIVSLHHNLFAHHSHGTPVVMGHAEAPGPLLDFRNNVVYDWVSASGEAGNGNARINLFRNIFKAGPSTAPNVRARMFRLRSTDNRLYVDENELTGSDMGSARNFMLLQMPNEFSTRHHGDIFKTDAPFDADPVTTFPVSTALRRVLEQSGASRPARDGVDERITAQYRLGGGTTIHSPEQTGGWPVYEAVESWPDLDEDGMADDWETTMKLDPSDSSDGNADRDGDGYANIEEFLNSSIVVTMESQ